MHFKRVYGHFFLKTFLDVKEFPAFFKQNLIFKRKEMLVKENVTDLYINRLP